MSSESILQDREAKDGHALLDDRNDNTEAAPDIEAWSFPSPEAIREELSKEFPDEQKEKVWTEAAEAVKASYDQLLARWKEEMDTLLVYAGVSSAVLTAFNVESYHLLQPDPSDPTLAVLQQISAQLNGYTFSPPFLNSTHAATSVDLTRAQFHAPASAVWLNVLWFSSLVFSFGSALLALFVKQWINEAKVDGTSRQSARLRQYRLNGLVKWRVGTIVVIPPILLQLASVLFLSGLLVLLWTLHSTVAAVVSLLVASFFTFFLGVTILPVFKGDCSYRSPASVAMYVVLTCIRNVVLWVIRRVCREIYRLATRWVHVRQAQLDRLGDFAWRGYDDIPTWRGRDLNMIHEHHSSLDRAIATSAYSTTAHAKFLSSMPVIFTDLTPDDVVMCFDDLRKFMKGEWGQLPEIVLDDGPTPLPMCALYGLRHLLARPEKGDNEWVNDVHVVLYHYFMEGTITAHMAELSCKTLCQLAVEFRGYRHLATEDRQYRRVFGLTCATLELLYDQKGFGHTYDTLSHVRAMYEVEMAAWDPSQGFISLRDATQAISMLVHCIRATISGRSQLSPVQADAMLAWGKEQLPRLHQWLRDLSWTGLHKGCLALSGHTAQVLAFRHIASHLLVANVIDPLIALGSMQGGRELVSKELIVTIEHAWLRACLAYPDFAPLDAIYVWSSGLDQIDSRLTELCAIQQLDHELPLDSSVPHAT
ncbi:hypothetical protein L227DRAFT_546481 [Lentinus tigrinus ALCF2SS1-6]|uniref:DUF6535 domain-containing protein n=1 Tax=Lentinus tigrinus ALCF2SS1-6 TaxID=1328759 RepID=A0A5C2SE30_9APHY|nr:hypothetical protein L227DRAFT_546481 [Lentinus tigrinus ALCF2SS1-6]